MGAAKPLPHPGEHHIWAKMRRAFTREEARLLLAGRYHDLSKLSGLALSTCRRYGHLVRQARQNDLIVVPGTIRPKQQPKGQPRPARIARRPRKVA